MTMFKIVILSLYKIPGFCNTGNFFSTCKNKVELFQCERTPERLYLIKATNDSFW